MSPLRLPKADQPEVSVVMVTYGGWDWPYRALEALVENTDGGYEAVVVDNASWDGTGDLLEELVEGASLVRNGRNEGFGPAANQGADRARGEYVCFLNPDCLVQPGWLDSLLDVLRTDPRAGAVIPRFLDVEGKVQEAGSAVDRQGWTHAFGAGAEADDLEHRFRRYVDYGSAACLVMRRATFTEGGGFDPAYVPAYCEDVDLSFRLAERGLRTVYEPLSTVVHAGATSTGDVTRARLIERNRRLLLERWGSRLGDRPTLTELDVRPHRLMALRDAETPDRILVLADRLPGEGDPLGRLLVTAAGVPSARVTVLTSDDEATNQRAEALLSGGVEVARTGDLEGWLGGRRFHYSVVISEGHAPPSMVARWQPQAEHRRVAGALATPPSALMASLGVW